ncbi:MAG TPA: hypothetical protein GXX20_04195 [Clostridiaceae bacterium]|nr:hypothetical protein [Clostridiaceae bacterium]
MKYRVIIPLLAAIALFVSGCGSDNVVLGPKRGVEEYIEDTIPVKGLANLDVSIESGNLEVYTWDKDEVKLEITKRIRGQEDEEALKKKLGDFSIDINKDENVVSVQAAYKGSTKNPVDISTDIRMYIPKKAASFDCNVKVGQIKFFDDIRCNLNFLIDRANVSINRMIGKLSLNADMCDLKVSEGRMLEGSNVKINMGNIYVKSEFGDEGTYFFDTGMGSLEVNLPDGSPVTIECVGSLEVNEFPETGHDTKVSLRSGMGKIAVRKY